MSSPVPDVVASSAELADGAADQGEAARPGHLDHGRALGEPPLRLDGIAEWPGHDRGPVRAAERVEDAVAAVGHRHLDALDAQLPARVADRRRHLACGRRALELVGSSDDLADAHAAHASGASPHGEWQAGESRPVW